MNLISVESDDSASAVRPFTLMREHVLPSIEQRREEIEAMYSLVMGRPEIDPVILLGVTVLQIMMRLPDRACIEAFTYDVRWRAAFGDISAFHPTTLVHFRNRIASHGKSKLVLESCLGAMREAGYLKSCTAVRIDSTHLLGRIANMSRLECVRVTLKLALGFLAEFGGPEAWEPWHGRYAERNPKELRAAPALIKADIDGYVLTGPMPAPPHSKSRFGTDSFIVDLPARTAACPAGNASSECDRINDAKYAQYGARYYFAWPAKTCAACPLRKQCVSKKNKLASRTLEVNEHHMTVQARRNLCKTRD